MGSIFVFCYLSTLLLPVGVSALNEMDLDSVRDTAELAYGIFKDYNDNENQLLLKESNEILIALSSKIDSMEKLTTVFLLLLQKNKIEETHMQIHSLMIDLKIFFESKEPERSEYKRVFMTRAPLAISRARYLSKHLLQVIPEINRNIIEKLADTSRCNLTALNVLKTEVKELILNSLLIELTVLSTSKDLEFSVVKDFWEKQIDEISAEFETIQNKCESKIPVLIVEDMDRFQNPKQLQRANKERYIWAWNDVFMFDNEMPEKLAHYDVRHVKVFNHSNNGIMKIVTYGTNDLKTSSFMDILLEILEEQDIYRLLDPKDIVSRMKNGVCKRRLRYSAIVVYFNKYICGPEHTWTPMQNRLLGDNTPRTETPRRSCSVRDRNIAEDDDGPLIEIDKDSQALRVDLNEVTITHCTSKWCILNWRNWLKVNFEVTGYFTVYVALDPYQKLDLHRINVCTTCQC